MEYIKRFFKQLFCEHDWRKKGSASITPYSSFQEYRCPKCKKITQTHLTY